MTQDNRYGEERVVTTTTYSTPPVAEAVVPARRTHPGLLGLALAPLLGLLSMFLPFAGFHEAFSRVIGGETRNYVANQLFNFWNIATGQRTLLLLLLLATLLLALVAYFTRASWARYLAGLLGLGAGLWLLVNALFRFSHSGLGSFFGNGLSAAVGLTSGIGRWIMALAGLALLLTALWSLLRGWGDDDTVVG
ncbi:MAG: hypothetical protein LBB58_01740 [Cellulomonadaceae bacterium]|jgi:hypothetical protein|nr:hypothetical protein [Cellulomonadaceae bacterium]